MPHDRSVFDAAVPGPYSRKRDSAMKKVILLRHGESTWNRENRFTGWTDVPLSEKGVEEARQAGRLLREGGFQWDPIELDDIWAELIEKAVKKKIAELTAYLVETRYMVT